jgi:hypothetical protein
MADGYLVNSQVIDSIKQTRKAVSETPMVWETGSGKAFNYVAQATAMAVQDATDNLRNISTMSTSAIGVAITQMMSSGDHQQWGPVVKIAQSLVRTSAEDFCLIGKSAAHVLSTFPPGDPKIADEDTPGSDSH